MLQKWFPNRRTHKRSPPFHAPLLEPLEDRTLPTIVFGSYPTLNAVVGSGPFIDTPHVVLIFWGRGWRDSLANQAAAVESSLASLMAGPYFTDLSQYHSSLSRGTIVSTVTIDQDTPTSISQSIVQDQFQPWFDEGALPEDTLLDGQTLYVVVAPPTAASPPGGEFGSHFVGTAQIDILGIPATIDFHFAWVSTYNAGAIGTFSLDNTTWALCHEIAESMTDPNGQGGVRLDQGAPENEISDGILNGSTVVNPINGLIYRLSDGNLVQPYWSQNDHADIIPDGQSQRFLFTPDTTTTFTIPSSNFTFYTGSLTANGDQISATVDDLFIVGEDAQGGVFVYLNGETAQFEPNEITGITLNPRRGQNQIFVEALPAGVALHIQSQGPDTVVVGDGPNTVLSGRLGLTQYIQGNIYITNSADYTTVDVEDWADRVGRRVTVTSSGVSGNLFGGGAVYFDPNIAALNLNMGAGADVLHGNTFSISGTPNPGIIAEATTTLLSRGYDTVNVDETFGQVLGYLRIENRGGADDVTIDDAFDFDPRPYITIDRYTDPQTNTLYDRVGGLGGADVFLQNGAVFFATLLAPNALTSGQNIVTVLGTTPTTGLKIRLGTTPDIGNVLATDGPLTIDGGGGNDTVNVGDTTGVQHINGRLFIRNTQGGTSTLIVDDFPDTQARTQIVLKQFTDPFGGTSYEKLTGLAPGDMYFADMETGSATILCGTPTSGSNTLTVTGTTSTPITLATGRGTDQVYVQSTVGSLIIDGDGGSDTVTVGGPLPVQNVSGQVVVTNEGTGLTTLTVDDSADGRARVVKLTDHSINGFSDNGSVPYLTWLTYDHVKAVTITGGDPLTGMNVFDIFGTAAGTKTMINGGNVAHTFNVGSPRNTLDGIAGPLFLDVAPNSPNVQAMGNVLNIHDEGSSAANFYTISADTISSVLPDGSQIRPFGPITYGFMQDLTLKEANGAGNETMVQGTAAGTHLTLGTGSGNDVTVFIIPGIGGPVSFDPGADANTTYLYDGPAAGDRSYTLTSTGVTSSSGFSLGFPSTASQSLALFTSSSFNETVNVQVVPVGMTWYLNAAGGQNTFNIGSPLSGLDTIQGDVRVDSSGMGDNSVNLNDLGATAGRTYSFQFDPTLNLYTMTSSAMAHRFIYDGLLQTLTLNAGNLGNEINVASTTSSTAVTLNTGGGTNTINVGGAGQGLGGLTSQLTVNGGAGPNYLNVLDWGTSSRQEYDLSASQISRMLYPAGTIEQTLNYALIQYVTLYGGNGADVFGVTSTLAGTTTVVYGGSGGNQFVVEDAVNLLDEIQGPVALHGGGIDNAVAFDGGNTVGHTYTLTTGRAQRNGMADITYDGMAQFVLAVGDNPYAPPSPDTVNVQSNDISTIIAAGTGDTVILGMPTGAGHTLQTLLGSVRIQSRIAGNESPRVIVDDSGNTNTAPRSVSLDNAGNNGYGITGLSPAPIYALFDSTAQVAILGSAGNESFLIKALPEFQMAIDGQGGTNTLDYSVYTGNVAVDLPLGHATGLADGIRNIQNVTGSIGNDVLVGDANPNVLIGGTGRNLIIGGLGADMLIGGPQDDILIAGYTAYDTNLAALDALLAAWESTTQSYAQRIATIQKGVAYSGGTAQLTNKTVHSNGVVDTLTGGYGQDWFFVSLGVNADVITDLNLFAPGKKKGETITPIK